MLAHPPVPGQVLMSSMNIRQIEEQMEAQT